ncbi:MAG: prolyl oligopeptidase family serine peptidase [Gemmatimonadaceae bacterium]
MLLKTPLLAALSLAAPLGLAAQSPLKAADAALASPTSTTAPTAPTAFDFSIKNIMRGPEVYGTPPTNIRWSTDSRWIYFNWVEPGNSWRTAPSGYRVRATPGSKPEKLTLAQNDSAAPFTAASTASANRRRGAEDVGGDIYMVDYTTHDVRRLTQTESRESNPVLSTDGKLMYFVRDNNAFSMDIGTGLTTQLTDLRPGAKPADSSAHMSPQKARLAQQQRDLFEVVREQLADDSLAKAKRAAFDSLRGPSAIYVGRDRAIQSISISPSGRAALVTLRTPAKSTPVEIPYWVTSSGYTEIQKGRTVVGDVQARVELLYVSLPDAKAHKLHLFSNDSLAMYAVVGDWNASGSDVVVGAFRPDNKQRVIYTMSANDGALHDIETLTDTAWVGGPCARCVGWYADGSRVWYVSEASGFAHLYTAASHGGDVKQLTSGKWEVRGVSLAPDERTFDLITNDPSPFDEHLFSLPVTGGTLTRITTMPGRHEALVSPDRKLVADVYSYVNRPPELYVMPNKAGATEAQLTVSPSAEFLQQQWLAPKIVMVRASDGAMVPAHIYRPEDVGAKPNGAAVIFVHGAGYLHNVGNFWSEYPREYLFNQLLARHGYVVMDADYRASDGYGRDWRTAIYRHMGGRDLQDEVDVSKYITATYGVPANRIGMYGGSYGGFMTLMALFTAPDYFGAGAALRSVTDWAHYNHGYTAAILNLPQDDTLAYHQSSPIYFAQGLRAPLLMAHGMVDTNVNYEDIVRLTERLIELGKTNWELASYPVESHGFLRPDSWTDEYTRIFSLFQRTIGNPAPPNSH